MFMAMRTPNKNTYGIEHTLPRLPSFEAYVGLAGDEAWSMPITKDCKGSNQLEDLSISKPIRYVCSADLTGTSTGIRPYLLVEFFVIAIYSQ